MNKVWEGSGYIQLVDKRATRHACMHVGILSRILHVQMSNRYSNNFHHRFKQHQNPGLLEEGTMPSRPSWSSKVDPDPTLVDRSYPLTPSSRAQLPSSSHPCTDIVDSEKESLLVWKAANRLRGYCPGCWTATRWNKRPFRTDRRMRHVGSFDRSGSQVYELREVISAS